jgi:HD-like signal output (HDOD) protein/GGDEF domain-containing protein
MLPSAEMNNAELGGDVLNHFVNRARRLYTLPTVALRVLELTGKPTVDVHELADCIEQDPALTIKILRTVNSSLFGLNQRVTNVKQSIALLGNQPLKMLVLGFSLPGNLASNTGAVVLQRYWQQTLLTALAAREIAESWLRLPGDDAFAAGLLQDLGLLLLVQDLGESYERFLVSVWQHGDEVLAEERKVLGFDHQFLTARLLEHWHLPAPFVASIERSSTAESIGDDKSAHVLNLASLVALFLIDHRPEILKKLLDAGERSCDLTMAKLNTLMTMLEQKTPQLAQVLSLELPGDAVYSDILLQAYKRLSEASDQAATHWLQLPTRPSHLLWERVAEASESESYGEESLPSTCNTWVTTESAHSGSNKPNAAKTVGPWSTRSGLIGRISAEVARCRQARSAVSLVLVEVDDLPSLKLLSGTVVARQIVQQLGSVILDIAKGESTATQISDTRFALVLRNCDRQPAVEVGWRITDSVRNWSHADRTAMQAALSVSVGVASLAMPPRNFPAEELLTAAERCLTGVQLSGGDSVKSIDIY